MATETASPPKSGKKGLLVLVLLVLVAVAGGATLPWILGGHRHDTHHADKKKADAHKSKLTVIAFPDVVVNLGEDRLNRFLKAKIMLAVEEVDAKEVTEVLNTQKAFMKSWLLSYLSDQSTAEITRKVGVNRIRREIRNQFNAMMFPDGEERITDILFDEFIVQ